MDIQKSTAALLLSNSEQLGNDSATAKYNITHILLTLKVSDYHSTRRIPGTRTFVARLLPREEQANGMDLIVILVALPGAVISALAIYDWIEQRRKNPK